MASIRTDLKRALALAAAALAPFALSGCGKKETPTATAKDHDHDHEHKGHEHAAPHGGTLVALGEEFAHVELVLDPATGGLTAYTLDGEAENSVRVKQLTLELEIQIGKDAAAQAVKLSLDAVGSPLTGETPGDSSEFAGQSEALKGAKEFEATLGAVEIRGRKFQGVAFNFPKGNE